MKSISKKNQFFVYTDLKVCYNENDLYEPKRINIIVCRPLTASEIKAANAENQNRRNQMDSIITMYRTKYRRDTTVKFIDEIMEEWNGNVT